VAIPSLQVRAEVRVPLFSQSTNMLSSNNLIFHISLQTSSTIRQLH
jgi:hypothetical protein